MDTTEQALGRLVQDLVYQDCTSGATPGALERAIERGAEIEPLLIDVLEVGPTPAMLVEFQRDLEDEWALRASLLAQGAETGLSPENQARAEQESFALYAERAETRLRASSRERAAFALAAIGSPSAVRALREISRHADAETRLAIARAQRMFAPKPAPGAIRPHGALARSPSSRERRTRK